MKQVFFSKLVRNVRQPVGVLTVLDDCVRLDYDDVLFGDVLSALYTVPMCKVLKRGDRVFKHIRWSDRLPQVLSRVRKPYYFSDPVDKRWKHSRILAYVNG